MKPQTPSDRKICLFQWVFVLLMGLLGGVLGALGGSEAASPLERLPGFGIGAMVGLTVSGVGMAFYMRWKRARGRA